jgi:hypothetical protein
LCTTTPIDVDNNSRYSTTNSDSDQEYKSDEDESEPNREEPLLLEDAQQVNGQHGDTVSQIELEDLAKAGPGTFPAECSWESLYFEVPEYNELDLVDLYILAYRRRVPRLLDQVMTTLIYEHNHA